MLPRALHTIFYVAYLLTLALALWFLLHYAKVEAWVWSFFAGAILIAIVGVVVKEVLMKKVYDSTGKLTNAGNYNLWAILYLIFHIMAVILVIVGFIFVIIQSTIPWWVWTILLLAVLLSIVNNMIFAYAPQAFVASLIIGIISLVLFLVAIVLVVIYSKSPWWVWLIVILALIMAILAAVFELAAEKRDITVATVTTTTVTTVAPVRKSVV